MKSRTICCGMPPRSTWPRNRSTPSSAFRSRIFYEPLGVVDRAADQPQRHWQAEPAGAQSAGGGAANGYPDRQRAHRLRVRGRVLQRRAELPGPSHPVLVSEPQQQVQLLGVEVVELGDVLAEQGERFGERAAAGDDLGPTVADQVEGAKS
jgi:hypothetical protein